MRKSFCFHIMLLISALLIFGCSDDPSGSTSTDDPSSTDGTSNTICWGTAELIENPDYKGGGGPQIVNDGEGNAFAIWSNNARAEIWEDIAAPKFNSIWVNRYDASSDRWSEAVLIESYDNYVIRDRQIMMDSSGNALISWIQYEPSGPPWEPQEDLMPPKAWARHYDASSGSWGTVVRIDNQDDGYGASGFEVKIDGSGNATAIWSDGSDIWARRFDVSGLSWGTAVRITNNDAESSYSLQNVIDSEGNIIALWRQRDSDETLSIWANRYDTSSGSWGMAVCITNNDTGSYYIYAPIKVDSDGDAIVFWVQGDSAEGRSLWVNRYDASSGNWGTAVYITNNDAESFYRQQIVINSDGDAIIFWVQDDSDEASSIWASCYDASSDSWGTAEEIAENVDTAGPLVSSSFNIVLDSVGNAVLVWSKYDPDLPPPHRNLWANRYDAANGNWGTAELIENLNVGNAIDPSIMTDSSGDVIVIWNQACGDPWYRNDARDLWAVHYDASSGRWERPVRIESASGIHSESPQIAMGSDGNILLFWSRYHGMVTYEDTLGEERIAGCSIWVNSYDTSNKSWGTAQLLHDSDYEWWIYFNFAIGGDGNVMMVWDQYDYDLTPHVNMWAIRSYQQPM